MESNWAAENLQTIRTLMERSSVYRRALAPVMSVAGVFGLAGAVLPCFTPIHSAAGFTGFWFGIAAVTMIAALLLIRRQALQDKEAFWSPPTRRVALAVTPCFLVGGVAGLLFVSSVFPDFGVWFLPPIWMVCYGCGLHAAGFFMPRGIRLFGWFLIASGCAILLLLPRYSRWQSAEAGHYVMGIFFGLAHLAYGVYLYFTEKRKNAA